jgi:hypothetical protein
MVLSGVFDGDVVTEDTMRVKKVTRATHTHTQTHTHTHCTSVR